jgi:hypothetical protein
MKPQTTSSGRSSVMTDKQDPSRGLVRGCSNHRLRPRAFSVALLLTLALLTAGSQPCEAQQPRFGVVRVGNKLDGDLTFFFRWVWADGRVAADWRKIVIHPGKSKWFAWEYGGSGQTSPTFYCRFDTERDKGRDFWEYSLTRGAAPDEKDARYGHHYEVIYVNERKEYAELRPKTPGAQAKLENKSVTAPAVREEPQPPDTPADSPGETCSISGQVSGQPANVRSLFYVSLAGPDDPSRSRGTKGFDRAGRYSFADLPPGRYWVGVHTNADITVGPHPRRREVVCQGRAIQRVNFELK